MQATDGPNRQAGAKPSRASWCRNLGQRSATCRQLAVREVAFEEVLRQADGDDLPPTEAYGLVLEPLRARYGDSFVANLNVLNGKTFEECMSPAVSGQAEVAPCAAGHPETLVKPAVTTLLEHGVSPEIVIHSSGEVELATRPWSARSVTGLAC